MLTLGTLPLFIQHRAPVLGMKASIFRVHLPSSVNSLWKQPHRHPFPGVHLLGDSKSGHTYVDNEPSTLVFIS